MDLRVAAYSIVIDHDEKGEQLPAGSSTTILGRLWNWITGTGGELLSSAGGRQAGGGCFAH